MMAFMKRLQFFTFMLIMCLGTSCSDPGPVADYRPLELDGSGVLISEERDVPFFNAINASGPITTVIDGGNTHGILVTADDNIITRVRTEVRNHTLYLSLDRGDYHNIWIRVHVQAADISSIANNGNGVMTVSGSVVPNELEVTNSGTGTIRLDGAVKHLILSNEGSGTVNAFSLIADHCIVDNSGSGSCYLFCRELLDGRNAMNGSILFKGNATVIIENTGHGKIQSVKV